jgi:hypothetical protein
MEIRRMKKKNQRQDQQIINFKDPKIIFFSVILKAVLEEMVTLANPYFRVPNKYSVWVEKIN